ncbi:hypothetical protein [Sphingobacterium cavernae]|uniref:hypothetical protein n=1 Tax=Sphingobacterium cavernae TaxID=2592657 RepID=UPI00122FDBFA|nr:hypothetical protein [Sphingobacterium cavernae]
MKVKMNRQQLEAVELIIRIMMEENKPSDAAEKLVYDIVYKWYSKIRTRVEKAIITKDGWSLKFTEQEALAVNVFLSNFPIPVGYQYEEIQLNTIYGHLDQEYGRLISSDSSYRKLAT